MLVDGSEIVTRAAEPADLGHVAELFETQRNTRHCWCMAPCETSGSFAVGWLTGGNRRRFEARVMSGELPMGVLAFSSGQLIGWCACGPRSRYVTADRGRDGILRERNPAEDDVVWLLACFFVREAFRRQGVTDALMRAAVDLAAREGAVAVEGWPSARPDQRAADAFLGRESAFERLGFTCIGRPRSGRALMRLGLDRRPQSQ
jgi:GNAT superfamily N-acetyltransferase